MEDETGGHRRGSNREDRKEGKKAGSLKPTNWFRLAAELDERLRTETGPPSTLGLRPLATLSRYVE